MKFALVPLALALLVSCQTAPAPIPVDATAEIYFQRAQAASDQGLYSDALKIYRTFLADRPSETNENIYSARYEIAFLLAKEGKDAEAIADFEAILADFNSLEKSSGAPGWVKSLSQRKLADLKDKQAKNKTKG